MCVGWRDRLTARKGRDVGTVLCVISDKQAGNGMRRQKKENKMGRRRRKKAWQMAAGK